MSNVAKLKKRALDYEQKKQFEKALDTYLQILAELDEHVDEADVALYNRVGDLLLRRGDVSEAVDHYEKAVDLYTEGGFFNNAIALCNKILRNAPGRNSIYYKLGKISARKGFINDAKQNFLEYADRMQKAGQLEEAFRALKEFADLCPDQDDIRLMLADQLVRKNRKQEAIEQLQALYEKFTAQGRTREARATVDRMKALDPELEPRAPGAQATPKAGDLIFLDVNYDEPGSKRGGAQKAPEPARTESPPAAAPAAIAPQPEPITSTAVGPEPSPQEPATAVSAPSLPSEPEIIHESDLPLIEVSASEEPEIEELPGITHGATLPDGIDDAGAQIHSNVDVGLITGFEQTSIGGEEDRATVEEVAPLPDLEPPPPVLRLTLEHGSAEELTPSLETVDSIAANASPTAGDLPMLDVPLELDDDSMTIGGDLQLIQPDDVSTSIVPASDPSTIAEPDVRAPIERAAAPASEPFTASPASAEPPALETPLDDRLWTPSTPLEPIARIVDRLRDNVEQHPEDWDAHRQLGEALLEDGDRPAGLKALETAMLGFERAGDLPDANSIAEELIRVEPNSVRHHQKLVEYAVRANDTGQLVDAYLALAECLLRSGQLDKSRAVYIRVLELAPEDPRAESALRSLGPEPLPPSRVTPKQNGQTVTPPASPATRVTRREVPLEAAEPPAPPRRESFVNLADWLKEDETPKSTRLVAEADEQPTEQVDFAEMLSKFKQGVAANVEETDHESHYDLGVAYKEMGLLDEAISEFQKALRGTEQRVRTYEALGQCFVEKRQYQIALTILTRALNDRTITDDMLVGVLYLLGYASEALGRWTDAQKFYERVFAVDIQFRDVSERLAAVERKAK